MFKPKYLLNFGSDKLDASILNKSSVDELIYQIEEDNRILIFGNIYESARFLTFFYKEGKQIGFLFYDKRLKKTYTSGKPINDIDNMYLFPIQFVFNNKTVSVMDMENLHLLREYKKSPENNEKLYELTSKSSVNDNPILMIGHLKK